MSNDLRTPSIFTIWSQKNLQNAIDRSAKFLLKYLSRRYPHLINENHIDELYCFINIVLQCSYLIKWNSSVSERFLKLKRCYLLNEDQLASVDLLKSLVQICLLPYFATKLEKLYENIQDRFSHRTELDRFILKFYPNVKKLFQLSEIIVWMAYITGNERVHSPDFKILWLGNLILSHSEKNISYSKFSAFTSIAFALSSFADFFIKSSLLGVDLIRRLKTKVDLNLLFKESFLKEASYDSFSLKSFKAGLCPLCNQKPIIPTALASSGFVFCNRCINDHLQNFQRCPITKFPSNSKQLIRIYN
uniref:Peroxisome assembly protein 12 n=2 Tax=Sarcoptes scabiei TaxID=52283 RepID=A0A834VHC0_SARSC